jgi:hypothetical protein
MMHGEYLAHKLCLFRTRGDEETLVFRDPFFKLWLNSPFFEFVVDLPDGDNVTPENGSIESFPK